MNALNFYLIGCAVALIVMSFDKDFKDARYGDFIVIPLLSWLSVAIILLANLVDDSGDKS